MARKRYSEEQIIRILKEVEAGVLYLCTAITEFPRVQCTASGISLAESMFRKRNV